MLSVNKKLSGTVKSSALPNVNSPNTRLTTMIRKIAVTKLTKRDPNDFFLRKLSASAVVTLILWATRAGIQA